MTRNTPISDEAISAYQDAWLAAVTDPQWAAVEEGPVRAGLAAAAPLLVSAEAERLSRERDEAERYGIQLTRDIEGLRAELAEAREYISTMLREGREFRSAERVAARTAARQVEPNADAVETVRRCVIAHLPIDSAEAAYALADDVVRSVAALRAAGGQEKPDDGHPRNRLIVASISLEEFEGWEELAEQLGATIHSERDSTDEYRSWMTWPDGREANERDTLAILSDDTLDRWPAPAPVGGQAEPSDAQIDELFGGAVINWLPGEWGIHEQARAEGKSSVGQNRAVYRHRLAKFLAAAAVSGEQL